MELLFLATLPMAVIAVGILKLFDLTDSGLAAGVVLISLCFIAFWVFDPPELGWDRRGRKQRRST